LNPEPRGQRPQSVFVTYKFAYSPYRSKQKSRKGENIMKEKVEAALQKVRPMLQADGGDVELVDVQDGIVTVRLQGACGGCPMSQMTLKNGIERILKQEVPEVVSVESAP
jgi:Fe-S cluster biogenesis protein NfuA